MTPGRGGRDKFQVWHRKVAVGWSGYLRPDQFLDHLTVIKIIFIDTPIYNMQCNLAISAVYIPTLPGSPQVKKKLTGHIQPTWLWQFENTAHSISSFLPLYLSRKRYIAIIIGLKPLKTSPLLLAEIYMYFVF